MIRNNSICYGFSYFSNAFKRTGQRITDFLDPNQPERLKDKLKEPLILSENDQREEIAILLNYNFALPDHVKNTVLIDVHNKIFFEDFQDPTVFENCRKMEEICVSIFFLLRDRLKNPYIEKNYPTLFVQSCGEKSTRIGSIKDGTILIGDVYPAQITNRTMAQYLGDSSGAASCFRGTTQSQDEDLKSLCEDPIIDFVPITEEGLNCLELKKAMDSINNSFLLETQKDLLAPIYGKKEYDPSIYPACIFSNEGETTYPRPLRNIRRLRFFNPKTRQIEEIKNASQREPVRYVFDSWEKWRQRLELSGCLDKKKS